MSRSYTFDAALNLHEPADLNASGFGSEGTIDLGSDTANFSGVAIFDIFAISTGSADALYNLLIVGSDTEDFSGSVEVLASMPVGAAGARPLNAVSTIPGRYELPFLNEQGGVHYKYLRHYVEISGAGTSINHRARIGRGSHMLP